ncbi:MAG: glycosyl hydrolase family 17 protein [Candidatus Erginobacter occultus]|nr:glycosyl hydrolase family 17 protein [Candidatus Erginobacter occultus]
MNINFFVKAGLVQVLVAFLAAPAPAAGPGYNYTTRFLGVCYSPTHYDAADNSNPQTTLDAFAKDFPLVSRKGFQVVRSYWLSSEAHYLNFVGQAYRNNLKVIIEVPVNPNFPGNNQAAIDGFNAFLAYVKATPESRKGQVMASVVFNNYSYQNVVYVTPSMFKAAVILVLAGNENIPAAAHESASLISLKDSIQAKLTDNGFGTIAVSYCLEADVWAGDPAVYPNRRPLLESLAPGVPFLMTCYPFEWGMPVNQAVEGGAHSLKSYVNQVSGHYPELVKSNPIIFGETGWATAGTADGSSPANPANAADYLSRVYAWPGRKTKPVSGILFFEAFDESTKTGPEYQKHYGLWSGGTPATPGTWKPGFPAPPVNHLTFPARDYDGDGASEIAVFRPSSGLWAVRGQTRLYSGVDAHIPIGGDFSGDGTAQAATFHRTEAASLWVAPDGARFYFGGPWEDPVPADYDGDGDLDAAVFGEDSGVWKVRDLTRIYFGRPGDYAAPGDYTGDGTADIGIFRPGSGLWAIRGVTRVYFGSKADIPVPGDYYGDGTREPAIFRPATGLWATRGVTRVYFGIGPDRPVPADYTGGGKDEIGIFRPASGLWAIRGLTRAYFGRTGDLPVTR